MTGKLNPTQVEELLAGQIMGRIGCHTDDITYVVPISYAYTGKYIYSLSGKGMKLDMMRRNPKVCFQVDMFTDMQNWRSVIAWGDFEELIGDADRREGIKLLTDRTFPLISSVVTHQSPNWPFIEKDAEKIKGVVYRIHLKEKTGRFETSDGSTLFSI